MSYNLLYRSFVGLGADEAVPDDTTLVVFRQRIGEEGVRKVFSLLNRRWEVAGLIGKDRRVVDGVHIWARVARRGWAEAMRCGRELVVEAVEAVDGELGSKLRGEFVSAQKGQEHAGDEAICLELELCEKLLEAVAGIEDGRVRQRAEILRRMMAEKDRPVSFDDVDARWGHKRQGEVFLGYKLHEAIDPDSRMVTAVDVVPGNVNEAVRTGELLGKESVPAEEGGVVIGDGLYNNSTTVGQVKACGKRPCFSGLSSERVSDDFDYDAEADCVVCAEGKRSVGKVRVDAGDLYYFSMKDCKGCRRRKECLTVGERFGKAQPRRRVYISDVRKEKLVAGEAGRSWRREHLRVRGRIEAKFSEQVNRHGLRRARYWGLAKVTVQVLLNVITVNLKRAARLIGRGWRVGLRAGCGPPVPSGVLAITQEVAC